MSGQQFVESLKELGYTGAATLDPQGFVWLFEKEDMVPFLEWFCSSVNSSNIITVQEQEEFAELMRSGEGILDGPQLEDALQTVTLSGNVSEETLREDISRLSEDCKRYKQRKDVLVQQRNRLSMHLTSKNYHLSKMGSMESKAKTDYKSCLERAQSDNEMINAGLRVLVQSVSIISGLYRAPPGGRQQTQQQQNAVFLSQLDLMPWNKMEDKFNQEVTAYSKKQFFEGIADMAGHGEVCRYELLDIRNPQSLLVRGEKEENYWEFCQEMTRLEELYPHSERLRIKAAVENKKIQACYEHIQSLLHNLDTLGQDIPSLSNQLQDAQMALQGLSRDMEEIQDTIKLLVEQNAASQITPILTGDYNLKISRQDYFTSNQDQLIEQLVVQRSRNEFLTMSYELEARNHRDIHRLLVSLTSQLLTYCTGQQDRLALMDDPGLTAAKHQRGTIDSRDASTLRLHQMIATGMTRQDKSQSHQLYNKYSSLVAGAERLQHDLAGSKASMESVSIKHTDRLHKLRETLQSCENLVYSGSSTITGLPQLTPKPLLEASTNLGQLLEQLEQAILDIIKGLQQKKKLLKSDSLLRTERELFPLFFNNPSKLRSTLEQISNMIQAQRVCQS